MYQCFNLAALVMTRATIASLGTAMLLLRPAADDLSLSLPDGASGSAAGSFDDVSWISTCLKVLLWRQTVMAVLLAIPATVLGARGLLGVRYCLGAPLAAVAFLRAAKSCCAAPLAARTSI